MSNNGQNDRIYQELSAGCFHNSLEREWKEKRISMLVEATVCQAPCQTLYICHLHWTLTVALQDDLHRLPFPVRKQTFVSIVLAKVISVARQQKGESWWCYPMLLAPSVFSLLNHFSTHITKNQKQKQNKQNKTINGHSAQVFACWFMELLLYQF